MSINSIYLNLYKHKMYQIKKCNFSRAYKKSQFFTKAIIYSIFK